MRRKLHQALEEYNRYRAPEAVAKLEALEGNRARVRFTGTFCRTCGAYDWYEDLVWILRDYGVEAEVETVETTLTGGWMTLRIRPSAGGAMPPPPPPPGPTRAQER